MYLRPAKLSDLPSFITLYGELHGRTSLTDDDTGRCAWCNVLKHPGTIILCAVEREEIVSAVTLHVLPNITYGGRSYGLIENVITRTPHRGKGIASLVMQEAIKHAWDKKCYKIMLLSGKHREAIPFYEKLGFSSEEKTGMIIRNERD